MYFSRLLFRIVFLFIAGSSLPAVAQELRCANEVTEPFLLQDPRYKAEFDAINQAIANGQYYKTAAGTILEIPLAVHIIHNGEPIGTGSNISDQQVIDAVRGANERWRLLQGAGLDMEVQFCLAQTDPDGNPSNGIDRVDGSGVRYYSQYGIAYVGATGDTGANELTIKNLSNWNHNYVYNVWVVNRIAGGWGGYAFFPLVNNFPTDGTVITYGSMRYSSSTLAHELGHGMGLFHTFNGDFNGCPGNSNCSLLGDQVCDTEPHRQSDCGTTSCSNKPDSILVNTLKNYMSYCGGRDRFTQGQKDRSRNIIMTTTRKNLTRSVACQRWCDTVFTQLNLVTCDPLTAGIRHDTLASATGCDSIVTTNTTLIAPPDAQFTFSPGSGTSIEFENLSQHADSFSWNFGDDSVSTAANPEHTYSGSGTFTVELVATNSCSSDTARTTVTILSTGLKPGVTPVKILLYPNPAPGQFSLDMSVSEPGNTVVELLNESGQLVFRQYLGSGQHHPIITGKQLPAGSYMLIVRHNGKPLGHTQLIIAP